jgi:hypothetical protein
MSQPESEASQAPFPRRGTLATVLGLCALAWGLPAFVGGYALLTMVEFTTLPVPGFEPKVHAGVMRFLFDPWQHWDGQWFLRIAESGYLPDDASAAFLPLYPSLVKTVAPVFQGDVLIAGCVVSWACLAAALVLLLGLLREEIGDDDAKVALVLLVAFPTALFFHAAYTESVFLLLTVASFVAARRGLFALAGCAALLATLTRWTGFAMVPALLVEAWAQAAARGGDAAPSVRSLLSRDGLRSLRGVRPTAMAFALLPAAALPIVLRVLDRAIGDPWGFTRAQRLWERRVAPPWVGLVDGVRVLFRDPPYLEPLEGGFPRLPHYPGGFLEAHAYNLLAAVAALSLAFVATRRLKPSSAALALASVVIPLMTPSRLQPLQSMPRFFVVIFPLFAVLAVLLRGRPLLTACLIAAFAAVQGFFAARFALWFWVA